MHRSKRPLGSIAESAARLDVARSLATGPAIGSPRSAGEFIVGIGSAAAWPMAARTADKERRRTRFMQTLQNMKTLVEGGKLN
jgi:hypothetical protein